MKENLSTTTSITSSYSGEWAGQYISAMLLAAPTLGNNLITVKPNIAYRQIVKPLTLGAGLLADRTCDFTSTSSITLQERWLEPKQIQAQLQLCKNDWITDYESLNMGFSAWKTLPKNFTDFLIGNVSATISSGIERSIWQGTGATSGEFQGFTNMFKADASVLKISGVSSITSANVQTELARVVAKIATTNIFGEKPLIYVATDVYANYLISLGGFGAAGVGAAGYKSEGPNQIYSNPVYFAGYEVVNAAGLPQGQMVAATKDNLWFGTSLISDLSKVEVLDMTSTDLSDNVRISVKFSAGVQYGIPAEIIYYYIY